MKIKEIEEKVLKVAIEIVKEGNGALFVIGENVSYEKLFEQKFSNFSIFENGAEKVLKGLAVIDGAVIIDRDGRIKEYGVMIKDVKAFVGFGTRHAAGLSASKNHNLSILCSEEERKIKVFKDGKYVMQIDALQKNVENQVSQISSLLESLGVGFLGGIGVVTLAPVLGITLLPGVLIFGGSYFAIKKIIEHFKKE